MLKTAFFPLKIKVFFFVNTDEILGIFTDKMWKMSAKVQYYQKM